MRSTIFVLALALQLANVFCYVGSPLINLQEWMQIDYNFPSLRDRNAAIQSQFYFPANVTPIDVDVDYNSPSALLGNKRIFVTTPRLATGVPISLGYVIQSPNGPLIQPYPDYSWHTSNGANCDGITSAFRVAIDACNRLWVIDSGRIETVLRCPPQLLVFDLNTDTLVHRYRFPQTQYVSNSLFISLILDTNDPPPIGRCLNTKVYVADVLAFGLVVYDALMNRSWRIQNRLFNLDPNFTPISLAGESINSFDGIFSFALSPRPNIGGYPLPGLPFQIQPERYLFLHSLTSTTEVAVPLQLINDPTIWENNPNAFPEAFSVIGNRGVQTPTEAMDSNGNLFFVLTNPLSLVCWDSSTPYTRQNIRQVHKNDVTLQFASSLKIIRNNLGQEEIWILTNRFQKVSSGTLNANEVNFRVQGNTINKLLKGSTRCNGAPI